MSAAKAIGDHVRDWWFGTKKAGCCGDGSDLWTSMGVYSDGSHYGIPADIIYSFPVKIEVRYRYLLLSYGDVPSGWLKTDHLLLCC